MHPPPSWFPVFFLVAGLTLILPVLIVGAWLGGWRRAAAVSAAMTALWGGFFVLYTQVGLPPAWVSLPITFMAGPLLLWRQWPRVKATLGLIRARQAAR